jgi:hypothetical protein
MIDAKVILTLALLLTTLQMAPTKPGPAGGNPIPVPNYGVISAQ